MDYDGVLVSVQKLNRADKLRLMQQIVSELYAEEIHGLRANQEYPVYSPYDAYEAAEVLQQLLDEHKISAQE